MREAREEGREEGKRGRRRMTQSTEEGVVIAFLEWKKKPSTATISGPPP